ncbi:MAG: hypothetical protein JXO72_16495 [Vicinamibacteria bacterium]|nr:hypothetical protein [Vicinamibacteria bacterium]
MEEMVITSIRISKGVLDKLRLLALAKSQQSGRMSIGKAVTDLVEGAPVPRLVAPRRRKAAERRAQRRDADAA